MNAGVIHRRGAENAEVPQRDVTEKIIGAAIEVHQLLDPGLLELALRRLKFEAQAPVALIYNGHSLAAPLKLDLLVEGVVIVEIEAVVTLERLHTAQLLTYLRLIGLTSGLLFNFNEATLKQGIQRVFNALRPSAFSAPLR